MNFNISKMVYFKKSFCLSSSPKMMTFLPIIGLKRAWIKEAQ